MRLQRKKVMEVSKMLHVPRRMQLIVCKRFKNSVPATQSYSRQSCGYMTMSGSATPATENDVTTCFQTFEQERFLSFQDTATAEDSHGLCTR